MLIYLQITPEVEYSLITRLSISTSNHFSPLRVQNILCIFLEKEFFQRIQEFHGDILIFTDGSKSDAVTGSAFCIYMKTIHIFTPGTVDCYTKTRFLGQKFLPVFRSIVKCGNKLIYFNWVTGYTGVPENELADTLATPD